MIDHGNGQSIKIEFGDLKVRGSDMYLSMKNYVKSQALLGKNI